MPAGAGPPRTARGVPPNPRATRSRSSSTRRVRRVDDATMRERFCDARVGRLATVTDEGHPHVVPCCFALAADDEVVYSAVDAKPKSTLSLRRLANLRARPY